MEKIEALIAQHAFFKGLEPKFLELIADCGTSVRFEAGQYIFREGDASDAFYAVCGGKIAVEIFVPGEGSITLQTLGAGDVLGWSWLIPPHKKQFDAKVIDATHLLKFDAKCLRKKCDQDPRFGYQLLQRVVQILGQRLQATRLQLLDVYGAAR